MGRRAYEIRYFKCVGCGNAFPASMSEQFIKGILRHTITMWCPFCKGEMDMKQVDAEKMRK